MFGRRWRALIAILAMLAAGFKPAAAGPMLLYDAGSDRVLYAHGADQPWYAASLTKMMTAYLVFEAWKEGRATKDEKLTISPKANAQPKMRLGFGAGKEITYDHAVKALIIVSANDIAMALAEAVYGSEEVFVHQMNAKAEKLGMTGTRFINPHGLPGQGQHTTAQDMARLAAALLRDYPEHMPYFGITMTEIGKMRKTIATHNPVLLHSDGGDGFKTGYTCSAGYNIVASASRDGRRLIAVILGEQSPSKRAARANAMLEHGFKYLSWKALFPAATIHSLPSDVYDRAKVIDANLGQRWKDCQDPIPTPEQIAKVAKKNPKLAKEMQAKLDAALAAEAAEGGQSEAASPVTTGSITTATAPIQAVPAANPAPLATPSNAAKPALAAAPAPAGAAKSPTPAPVATTSLATAASTPVKPKTPAKAVATTPPASPDAKVAATGQTAAPKPASPPIATATVAPATTTKPAATPEKPKPAMANAASGLPASPEKPKVSVKVGIKKRPAKLPDAGVPGVLQQH